MLKDSPLGQNTPYIETYSPDLLFPLSRQLARDKIQLFSLPFTGADIWTGYEISWLNQKGKPMIAMGSFSFPCESPNIIESKSFKLYLNSFNQTSFDSFEEVEKTIQRDLSKAAEFPVDVNLFSISQYHELKGFPAIYLDNLNIETSVYEVDPFFLKTLPYETEESLYSDLLKSNCLATGQPDWGSLFIRYRGNKIDHEGLLKYIISYRNHSGFAEHCVEQIYRDILDRCHPKQLTVYARYTRRGGLDINPFRSNFEEFPMNSRQFRQ